MVIEKNRVISNPLWGSVAVSAARQAAESRQGRASRNGEAARPSGLYPLPLRYEIFSEGSSQNLAG